MAFSSNCVVAVKVKGKVVRDGNGNNGERNVYLPHGTEYSLLLKNLTNRNAVASVEIDGSDALGGERVVVPANDSIELKRFMLDGDKDKGAAFKFVSLDSGDEGIVDPSSKDNGLIVARFYHEKMQYHYVSPPHYSPWDYRIGAPPIAIKGIGSCVQSPENTPLGASNVCDYHCYTTQMDVAPTGATAEGSNVTQTFTNMQMDIETFPFSTVKLRLRVRGDSKIFCQMCGKRKESGWKHCPYCGVVL